MMRRRRAVLHAVGFVWVVFNVWISWVGHEDSPLLPVATLVCIIANPALFGMMGYIRGRRRGMLMIVWPALAGLALLLTPPVSYAGWHVQLLLESLHSRATFWELFWAALPNMAAGFTLGYLAVCAVIYLTCAIISRRRSRSKAADGGGENPEAGPGVLSHG